MDRAPAQDMAVGCPPVTLTLIQRQLSHRATSNARSRTHEKVASPRDLPHLHPSNLGFSLRGTPYEHLKTDSPLATILVGPPLEPETFLVHKELLISSIPFFAAALRHQNFSESHTDNVSLPTEDPKLFNAVMHWLYSPQTHLLFISKKWSFAARVDLAMLADRLCCAPLRDLVVGELAAKVWLFPDYPHGAYWETVEYVFENSVVGSPMWKFAFDICQMLFPERLGRVDTIRVQKRPCSGLLDCGCGRRESWHRQEAEGGDTETIEVHEWDTEEEGDSEKVQLRNGKHSRRSL